MEPFERVVDCRCHTGENPLWHPDENCLYWIDIPKGQLFRYNPKKDTHELCYETSVIGGFTIQKDGSLLLFEDDGRVEIWDGEGVQTVVTELPGVKGSRFNDVIADPLGGVFCGTMRIGDQTGRLYRLAPNGTMTELFTGISIPNGLGFTQEQDHLYFTESEDKKVYRFAYNSTTGEISNRTVFVDTAAEVGVPDGMTVDAEGYVWSARWNGSCLVRYTPDGDEDRRVELPARKVSSVTFGGNEYSDLYVTTALGPGEGPPGRRVDEGDGAGALFRVQCEVDGRPEFRSRITC